MGVIFLELIEIEILSSSRVPNANGDNNNGLPEKYMDIRNNLIHFFLKKYLLHGFMHICVRNV